MQDQALKFYLLILKIFMQIGNEELLRLWFLENH